MKKLIIPLAATIALFGSSVMAASPDKAKSTEGNPTSARTPGKQVPTPQSQVDTTKSGETSNRTPSKQGAAGAASGERGRSTSSGQATNQAWDQTYQSDIAQEKQLKSGGGSK